MAALVGLARHVGTASLAGIIAGVIVGGLVYAVAEPWLRRVRPWHGLAFGVGLLLAYGFLVLDPFNVDFRRFGVAALNVAMFAGLFVIFGVAIAWLFDVIAALRVKTGVAARVTDALAWFAIVPAVIVALLIGSSVGGFGDPNTTFVIVAPLFVAAIVRWRRSPQMLGYASLAVGVLLGAARTLSGLPQLIGGL